MFEHEGHDADLIRDELADPADKANEAFTWRERALHWKADKERAEAEVARHWEAAKADEEAKADLAAENTELRATVDRVRATLEKVRKIHERREQTDSDVVDEWCVEEDADWPCPTIRALDGGES